jgi:hypothetical protein
MAAFAIACVEATIENEIRQGCNQRQIAQTYALALRSDWPTDWARVNAAIAERWPKALDRIKKQAWSGACFSDKLARQAG